jgi:NAD(P)-dependent dehydrogenase (short-subunit alcohol dehydrogenase family)
MEIAEAHVLVTGGASGLGAAVARRLAAEGARVAVLDRDGPAARSVAEEIAGRAWEVDVASDAAEQVVAEAASIAPIRGLVNCAGIATGARIVGREGPMPLAEFERTIRVNLVGTFNMMRLAAARMAETPPMADGARGAIVNTASVAAFDGQVGQAAYAASKGGVAALTLPAARDLARIGVRVTTVAPGVFATPMMAALPDEVQKGIAAAIPFPHRLGQPEEFADAVLFCLTNGYLNGETIRLDGAVRLPPG